MLVFIISCARIQQFAHGREAAIRIEQGGIITSEREAAVTHEREAAIASEREAAVTHERQAAIASCAFLLRQFPSTVCPQHSETDSQRARTSSENNIPRQIQCLRSAAAKKTPRGDF